MKKSIKFILAFVLLGQFSNAQSIKFGVKGGANFSNVSIQGVNSGNLTSYHFGAILEIKTPFIGIQPEILYSSQGATVSGFSDVKLDYVAVPIVLKYYITKLSLEVGPQFSFLVNDNLVKTAGSADVKKSDVGILGGVGLNLIGGLFTQARYVVGLTENSGAGLGKNNVFQLSVGYKF